MTGWIFFSVSMIEDESIHVIWISTAVLLHNAQDCILFLSYLLINTLHIIICISIFNIVALIE